MPKARPEAPCAARPAFCRRAGLAMVLLLVACMPSRGQRAAPATPPTTPHASAKNVHIDLASLAGRRVVLVTHPMPRIIEAFRQIVAKKALDLPGLALVGLYHAAPGESYEQTIAALAADPGPWAGLIKLSCEVSKRTTYEQNDCSKTFRELVAGSHAMVFTGGWDVPPSLYGEKTKLTTAVRTPLRHAWEISLLFHLLGGSRGERFKPLLEDRPRYAVLAICLGMQSMNVATGGTLHQDVLSDIYALSTFEQALALKPEQLHRNPAYSIDPAPGVTPGVYHPLRFTGGAEFWKELSPGEQHVSVMSVHHQSVGEVGMGLEVIATSMDGRVIEAVRHERFVNVLGIQFHPEYHYLSTAPPGTPDVVIYAVPRAGDTASAAFHRRFWQRFGRILQQGQL